jgi:alpha-N-arabinofuranosidase
VSTCGRRRFLRDAAAAGATLLAGPVRPGRAQRPARATDSRIEVLLEERLGRIAPEVHGHFVEHLGGVVYDGIWVGEGSPVSNIGGLRRELVERLRRIRPPVIRWPGGCFADQYDWRDGTGPRERRPRRTNFWIAAREWPKGASRQGPQAYDPNHFGTVEFVRFCRLVGAAPYLAANVRSLRPHDFWQWVEYCNAPAGTTALAEQRASDGERDPLDVRYWGVGNESWGCGGNFTAEEYATEYRQFAAWLPRWGEEPLLIAAGPPSGNVEWTRGFFTRWAGRGPLWGWALHHYSWNASGGRTTDWFQGKSDAVRFDDEQYHELLREADQMESLILKHWEVMGETERQRRVKLVVDEWGAWHAPGTEPFPEALLGQQNTMRDALVAALTLDAFHRHPDKVAMANLAQLVNCLQSLFFAHEDRFCVTPTYHVFEMYAPHQGAEALRAVFSAPRVHYTRNGQPATIYGLNGSASVSEGRLRLTVTNPSLREAREAEIAVRGGRVLSGEAVTLASPEVRRGNSFEDPRAVEPKREDLAVRGRLLVHRFPPASVTSLDLVLG